MSAFDDLDALVLDAAQALFGDTATIYPMKSGAAGPNAPATADTDPDRPVLTDVAVIRSEWPERLQIGGNGMPTPTGAFKLAASGIRHVATLKPADLAWTPRKGDELVYDDRPARRFRIVELMPDGLSGLHCGLADISE